MKDHYCYIFKAGPFCKIGYSNDIAKRLETMQTGCPYIITVLVTFPYKCETGARAMEAHLHHFMRKHHVHREWFNLRGVLKALKKQCKFTDSERERLKTELPLDSEALSHMRQIKAGY